MKSLPACVVPMPLHVIQVLSVCAKCLKLACDHIASLHRVREQWACGSTECTCCSVLMAECGGPSIKPPQMHSGLNVRLLQCRGKQYRTLSSPEQPAASPSADNPTETEALCARAASHKSASTSQPGAAFKSTIACLHSSTRIVAVRHAETSCMAYTAIVADI